MINHSKELTKVGQDFIDAVSKNNGRPLPRVRSNRKSTPQRLEADETTLFKLLYPLKQIEPGIGYDDWIKVGMVIYNETDGSEDGLELFDRWSSAAHNYPGFDKIERLWSYFHHDHHNPVRIGTLFWMIGQSIGANYD